MMHLVMQGVIKIMDNNKTRTKADNEIQYKLAKCIASTIEKFYTE